MKRKIQDIDKDYETDSKPPEESIHKAPLAEENISVAEEPDEPVLRILCIDGGGIRGIIPAYIIQKIEEETKMKINELFHMVAGTSTGGIIATAITKQNSMTGKEAMDMYKYHGQDIFNKPFILQKETFLDKIVDLFSEQYSATGLEKILKDACGDLTLQNLEKDTSLLATSFDVDSGKPHVFKSLESGNPERNFYLRDVARATSAAPTYFTPAQIQNEAKKTFTLVDGGVFATNPSMCALVAASVHFPKIPRKNIFMVSLGTGSSSFIPLQKLTGDISWAEHIVDVLTLGVASATGYQVKEMLDEGVNYFRIDEKLDADYELDHVKKQDIEKLEEAAKNLYDSSKKDLEEVYKNLKKPKTPWEQLGFVKTNK